MEYDFPDDDAEFAAILERDFTDGTINAAGDNNNSKPLPEHLEMLQKWLVFHLFTLTKHVSVKKLKFF